MKITIECDPITEKLLLDYAAKRGEQPAKLAALMVGAFLRRDEELKALTDGQDIEGYLGIMSEEDKKRMEAYRRLLDEKGGADT